MPKSDPSSRLVNPEAERSVVGACLIDPSAFEELAPSLSPNDFHLEEHRWMWEAMTELHRQGLAIDAITVADELDLQDNRLKRMGGSAKLTELITTTPSALSGASYATLVKRLSILRRLIQASGKIAELAYNGHSDDLDGLFDQVQHIVDAVTPQDRDGSVLEWTDSLNLVYEAYEQRAVEQDRIEKGTQRPRATFPWISLADYASHLKTGMWATVAANTAVGKTTFLECCAEGWAQAGIWTVFFHFELPHQFMVDRRTVRLSGETLRTVEAGELTAQMRATTEQARGWPAGITYVYCPGWSAMQIARAIRRLHARGLCDAAVIDYIQMMPCDGRGMTYAQARGKQVQIIKDVISELGIPALSASQFSRRSHDRGIKTAADIRDSGEIEEKSNLVITLDREMLESNQYGPTGQLVAHAGSLSPIVTGRVAKNTAGPTGPFQLRMLGHRYMMVDADE